MITLNQLIILFKDIAARHKQVNDFAAVQDFNIDTEKQIYPILVVSPTGANLPRTDNGYTSFTTTFDLQVIGLVNKDNDNRVDVLSDTQQILNDVINEFNSHPNYIEQGIDTINDISFEPLRGVYDTDSDGWKVSITIETPNKISFCGNPIENLSGFDFSPASVEVDDNGTIVNLYPSDSYTCQGVVPSGIAYNRPSLTGQSTSYAAYDDAWNLANGVYNYTPPANPAIVATLSDFNTLVANNAFGNNNRFTDEDGLQVYGNGYIIDHLTGLGYTDQSNVGLTWAGYLSAAESFTLLGFDDFRITNFNELQILFNMELTDMLNYAPFNNSEALYFYTSNTDKNDTSKAIILRADTLALVFNTKLSGNRKSFFVRNHY